MDTVRDRLLLALDRVEFARSVGIEPDEWQRELLASRSQTRTLLNCSRQSGKSLMAAVIALHRALYYDGSLVLLLAPAERQAKETFSKVTDLYRRSQKPGTTIAADSYRKLGIELTNGSRIEALPGTEKTIRGFSDVDLLILDEASRVDDGLYYAVTPMLAVSGGALMMLSTPNGRRGVFYEEWTGDDADWQRYEIPATQCPRISADFLEKERLKHPGYVYRQEYMCRFEEIEGSVFASDVVDQMFSQEYELLWDPEEAEMVR